eukprot:4157823-Prymnesium_polylepis.1
MGKQKEQSIQHGMRVVLLSTPDHPTPSFLRFRNVQPNPAPKPSPHLRLLTLVVLLDRKDFLHIYELNEGDNLHDVLQDLFLFLAHQACSASGARREEAGTLRSYASLRVLPQALTSGSARWSGYEGGYTALVIET